VYVCVRACVRACVHACVLQMASSRLPLYPLNPSSNSGIARRAQAAIAQDVSHMQGHTCLVQALRAMGKSAQALAALDVAESQNVDDHADILAKLRVDIEAELASAVPLELTAVRSSGCTRLPCACKAFRLDRGG
jgi:hypothetical protein